jgi:hypothetical protein
MMLRWFKALALGLTVLFLLLAACGDDGSPPTPGGVGGEPPGGTVVPNPPPLPTVTDVPGDWQTFRQERSQLSEAFTFSYPARWFVAVVPPPTDMPQAVVNIHVTPWDTANPPVAPPPGSLKIDILVTPPDYGCGPPRSSGAVAVMLSGLPAQRTVVEYPKSDGELVKSERVWLERDGRLYCIAAHHTAPLLTETTFATFLHSFKFEN